MVHFNRHNCNQGGQSWFVYHLISAMDSHAKRVSSKKKKRKTLILKHQLPMNQTQNHMQNPNTSKMSKNSNTQHNKKSKPNKKFNTNKQDFTNKKKKLI
jgi:hypothetical protein